MSSNNLAPASSAKKPGSGILRKLSVDLLKTYNLINQKYYAKRKLTEQVRSNGEVVNPHDDENSDYIVKVNERLDNRYIIESVIGKGSFGRVCKAYDEIRGEYVAIKIIKSKRAFRKQAQIEIEILQALHEGDPQDQYNIVRMKDMFMHENHQCIVFELLSYNLYELLRDTKFHGVSLNLIRKFARQLLHTLDYSSKCKGGIVHCDLKPENILLRNSRHSAIKVIDFGSACFHDKKLYTYIQSRFYRAPEVLLGSGYNCAIDMWSLGCILVEMHTGKPLFDGSNAREQIVLQCEVLGLPPPRMLDHGRKTGDYFFRDPESNAWKLKAAPDALRSKGKRTIRDIVGVDTHGPRGSRAGEKSGHTYMDYLSFEDLVSRMLDYDPRQRITPEQALQHKFFTSFTDYGVVTEPITPPVTNGQLYTLPLSVCAAAPHSSLSVEGAHARTPSKSLSKTNVIDLTKDDEKAPLTSRKPLNGTKPQVCDVEVNTDAQELAILTTTHPMNASTVYVPASVPVETLSNYNSFSSPLPSPNYRGSQLKPYSTQPAGLIGVTQIAASGSMGVSMNTFPQSAFPVNSNFSQVPNGRPSPPSISSQQVWTNTPSYTPPHPDDRGKVSQIPNSSSNSKLEVL